MNADTMTLEEVRALLIEKTVRNRRGTIACPAWAKCVRDAIDAAIKQREQDKRDAARYQWLRDKSGRAGSPHIRCDDPPFKSMDYWKDRAERAEAELAAIKARINK